MATHIMLWLRFVEVVYGIATLIPGPVLNRSETVCESDDPVFTHFKSRNRKLGSGGISDVGGACPK